MDRIDRCGVILKRISEEFGCRVHLAAELEFCISGERAQHASILQGYGQLADAQGFPVRDFAKEQGECEQWQQYELRLAESNAEHIAASLDFAHQSLPDIANTYGSDVCFTSLEEHKLFSGMHLHLHLTNEDGDYLFFKQDTRLSDALSATLGGLLCTMPALMHYFAPDANAWRRIAGGADHVPVAACWGNNNRTAALRLPESVVPHRHIEHRVPAAHANAADAIYALLVGVHYGLEYEPDPGEQLYGDARRCDDLQWLPRSADEAAEITQTAEWMQAYF